MAMRRQRKHFSAFALPLRVSFYMTVQDKEYFEYLTNRSAFQFWARKPFLSSLSPYLPGKVLDAGCGIGEFSQYCRGEYYGIDINPYCVEHVSSMGKVCRQASVDSIPFEDHTFDSVLLSHVFEHIDKPDRTLQEIHRVLRPGGIFMILVPMQKGFHKDSTHVRFYTKETLKNTVEAQNFSFLKSWYFPLPFKIFGDFLYFNELRGVFKRI